MTAPQHENQLARKTGPMTTPTIRAIETEYAGHRFRSRLEARWAVFFDHLGIQWRYEAQGYDLGDGVKYLPDFELPGIRGGRVLVEVKGEVDQRSVEKMLLAARHLDRVLLLQDIPKAGEPMPMFTVVRRLTPSDPAKLALWPAVFIRLQDEARNWFLYPVGWPGRPIEDVHDPDDLASLTKFLQEAQGNNSHLQCRSCAKEAAAAFDAARRARFEHGERG